jgi:hypothetical protein
VYATNSSITGGSVVQPVIGVCFNQADQHGNDDLKTVLPWKNLLLSTPDLGPVYPKRPRIPKQSHEHYQKIDNGLGR